MDVESNVDDMRAIFNKNLAELLGNKSKNSTLMTEEKYMYLIKLMKALKNNTVGKKQHYNRMKRYDVLKIGDREKLIFPVTKTHPAVMVYAHTEELFDIIHEAHLSINHGGRTKTMNELQRTYKNITSETVTLYIGLCDHCKQRNGKSHKAIELEPLANRNELNDLHSRCQIDLIDMQCQPDKNFKIILMYQEHATKFLQLRALKSGSAYAVANALLDIFTVFGAPCIIQGTIGTEFLGSVVQIVTSLWDELNIVQGDMEQPVRLTTSDVKIALEAWMQSKKSRRWNDGLRFVQLMKNREYQADLKCSPHEAKFRAPHKVGLKSTSLPHEAFLHLRTEDELRSVIMTMLADEDDNDLSNADTDSENNTAVWKAHSDDEKPGSSETKAIPRKRRINKVNVKGIKTAKVEFLRCEENDDEEQSTEWDPLSNCVFIMD